MIQVLSSPKAPAAIGPYSQGIACEGKMVFVSGQLPVVPETGELKQGSVGEMCAQSLRNIEAILREAGCTLADVVKTTIFLRDMGDFAEVNAAYAPFFPQNAPARACVQVAKLPKDAAIEIEAIACKG